MGTLKVVGLISGGKDSLFSILHCLKNGHEIVALANLHPPKPENGGGVEDMDSYMYQTVGHSVIPLYKEALGLPLYRQEISGTAANQDKCYGPAEGSYIEDADETEALLPLLRKVKAYHPEVNALSNGAILSDYQRTRVESVAIRLGLVPLSYLWQWPNLPPHSQSSLLEDMASVGQEARIIKVASGGLDDSFLWQNVADPRTITLLEKAGRRFGSADDGAVLGEGGEYETLAVAGPSPLWKGRIGACEEDRKIVIGEAGSATLHISKAKVEIGVENRGDISGLRTPSLLEDRFQAILESISEHKTWQASQRALDDVDLCEERARRPHDLDSDGHSHAEAAGHILLSNLTGDGETPVDQMRSIMEQLTGRLGQSGHCLADVAYTTIILRDMATFALINAIYGAYFLYPNPPARVTIACAAVLPSNIHLAISVAATKVTHADEKKGLHVQSRSYWAPANIGPYSQAISVPVESDAGSGDCALVYVAGQIPLNPASMELPSAMRVTTIHDFAIQAVLALQHVERIGRVMLIKQWNAVIAFITATTSEAAKQRKDIAQQAWQAFYEDRNKAESSHDEAADVLDVWDVKFGVGRHFQHRPSITKGSDSRTAFSSSQVPTLYVIQVDALPRGAAIEWVTYGLTGYANSDYEIQHFRGLLETFRERLV